MNKWMTTCDNEPECLPLIFVQEEDPSLCKCHFQQQRFRKSLYKAHAYHPPTIYVSEHVCFVCVRSYVTHCTSKSPNSLMVSGLAAIRVNRYHSIA